MSRRLRIFACLVALWGGAVLAQGNGDSLLRIVLPAGDGGGASVMLDAAQGDAGLSGAALMDLFDWGTLGAAQASVLSPEDHVHAGFGLNTSNNGSAAPEGPAAPKDMTVASFDLAALDSLPQLSFRTSTPWTQGVSEFSGPSLRSVIMAAGGTATVTVVARAANDYRVVFSPQHLEPDAPILATRIDGKPFGLRDRGPLWVVYPYDASERYRSEEVNSFSIWQVVELELRR